MKKVAEKKDVLMIMIILLGFVVAMIICSFIMTNTIIDTSKEPRICVPLINESYKGDNYYVYCMDKEEYELEMEALRYEKMV